MLIELKKWIKMTSMAAGRRVKVIFQLESGFGTHQKITIFNHQMFPSGPTVSTTEVQGWKKVRIRLLTCVIFIPGDSTITIIKNNSEFFASVVFDKT